MNHINQNIDFHMWCIRFCEGLDAPHMASVRSLAREIAIRDAIRYRGPNKANEDAEYIERKLDEQGERLVRAWAPYLGFTVEEEE